MNNAFFLPIDVDTFTTLVEHLMGAPLLGWLLALPTNIRLGWKSLPGKSTIAYYQNS
jgi:hypothetical protein